MSSEFIKGQTVGDFCEFCGRKIKFKENTEVPAHLTEDY